MQWYEIFIIVLAAAFVIGMIVRSIVRRKQGKTDCGCGCGCGDCANCSSCRGKAEQENKQNP